jgi:hypothetical protein
MHMKKILWLFLIPVGLVSCKKDFLQQPPVSTVVVDAVYKTDNDFLNAIVGCYSVFQTQYQGFWMFGDLRSDVSQQYVVSNVTPQVIDNFTIPNNTAILESSWSNYYSIISRCNTVLQKIAPLDSSVITHKTRDVGEAEFLRAMAYFDLVRIFGNVPIITAPIDIASGYKAARDSVSRVYSDIIVKDLQDAVTKLPASYTGTDIGRATKGAALGMLGKVYLYQKDFANAEATLQQMTTMGYALVTPFSRLFDYSQSQHHSEYIYDIEYLSGGLGLGSSFTNSFLPNAVAMANYYGINGSRGETNSPTDTLFATFEAGDQRKDVTVGVKGGWYNGSTFVPLLATTAQSYTKKYITPVPSDNDSKANWIVLRYADVLLMYAEALNENGKTATALNYLNQVRTRAGLGSLSGLSQDAARAAIYHERWVELAFEGQRWFDLVRTGLAYTTMQKYGMQPYMTVFPVPLRQVQIINNPSIFPQNPGYN